MIYYKYTISKGGTFHGFTHPQYFTKLFKRSKRILGFDLKKVIVYGSYARGDYNEQSGIDIMILTSNQEQEIRPFEYQLYDVAFNFKMEYGMDKSVIVKRGYVIHSL